MATALLADIDGVLKDDYEGPIRNQIARRSKLWKLIGQQNKRSASGRQTLIPLHLGYNTDVISLRENGLLPEGQLETVVQAAIGQRYHYGAFRLGQPAISAARNDKGAFIDLFTFYATSLVEAMAQKFNRDLWGDGSGVLARVQATTNANTVRLRQAPDGSTAVGANTGTVTGASGSRYIEEGMQVAIGSAAELAANAAWAYGTVRSIEGRIAGQPYSQITCNQTMNVTNGDYVVRASDTVGTGDTEFGLNAAGAYDENSHKVMNGIQNLFDDGTIAPSLHGVTHRRWRSAVFGADATITLNGAELQPLTQDLLQQVFDRVDETGSDDVSPVGWLAAHHSLVRRYLALLVPDVRYVARQLQGGFTKLSYTGGEQEVPFWIDRDCPYNRLFAGGLNALRFYESRPGAWEKKGGGIAKIPERRDSIFARWVQYGEMACIRRNGGAKVLNIQVSGLNQ